MSSYILLLAQPSDELCILESLIERLRYAVAIANSEDQAVAHARKDPPFLVILAGNQPWSRSLVNKLRKVNAATSMTIVALTDVHAPSWLPQEENPGFDGFLVNPVSSDVLASLVHSACIRQLCLATN